MILYEVRKISDKNGKELRVVVSGGDASKDGVIDKIQEIELLSNNLIETIKRQENKLKHKPKNSVKLHWQMGDSILDYDTKTKLLGFEIKSLPVFLNRFINERSESYWRYHLQFRNTYKQSDLNEQFSIEIYNLLTYTPSKHRGIIEEKLRTGEIKTTADIRKLKKQLKQGAKIIPEKPEKSIDAKTIVELDIKIEQLKIELDNVINKRNRLLEQYR